MTVKSSKSSLAPSRRREKAPSSSPAGPLVLPPIPDGSLPRLGAGSPTSKTAVAPLAATSASGTAADPAAARSALAQDPRQRNCVEMLTEGFVQAYTDFFYLTHRPDPNPGLALIGQADREIQVSEEDMAFLRSSLCDAELARRKGDTRVVFACFNALSDYYLRLMDCKTCIYFLEKCLDIAKSTSDVGAEMSASHRLGCAYEALKDTVACTGFHERHLQMAREQGDVAQENIACRELVRMYRAKAVEMEAAQDLEAASQLYRRCLDCAQECADRAAEGQANYSVGRSLVLLNKPDKALPFLKNYLEISKESEGKSEDQGKAFAALAAAYQKLGDVPRAVESLEKLLRIAQDSDNLAQQAEACTNLGVVHSRSHAFAESIKNFELAYELSRTMLAGGLGRREAVDHARVNLGMARGNARMGQFMAILSYDMSSLLQWKSSRVALDAAAYGAGRK